MKKITVSEIPEEGLHYTLSEKISHEEIDFKSPVEGVLQVYRTGSEVLLQGVLKVTLMLICSRCLKDFEFKINSPVRTVFHHARTLTRDEHYQLHDEELESEFYRGDTIDLGEFIIQEVLLNMPMKPLCKADCKGICPMCGTDLNLNSCRCIKEPPKEGLLSLDKILQRKEYKNG